MLKIMTGPVTARGEPPESAEFYPSKSESRYAAFALDILEADT
jgi:hypothetical protein